MLDELTRIENKIDRISDRIGSIDVTLAAQHESLSDHIRRTELLEETVKPLVRHDAMMQGALKVIGILALGGTIIEGLIALLTYIRH